MLSERIVNDFIRPLTSDDREDVFIVDDSAYKKNRVQENGACCDCF